MTGAGKEDSRVEEKERPSEKELRRIAASLGIPEGKITDMAPFICEEDGSEYAVWRVDAGADSYVLKKAKDLETDCYSSYFRDRKPYAPALLGSVRDGEDDWLLLEYCPGETLRLDDREMLRKAIDALAQMQDEFWQREELYGCAVTMDRALRAVDDRGKYLGSELLERAYALFRELYKRLPRTLCHEDLLPINVLVGDRAVLIDWEYGGMLPYLSSFARLIAHGRDDDKAEFRMKEEDLEPAAEYYYGKLVSRHGIPYEEYRGALDFFLFYEYCEWVMLGNRYDQRDEERYSWYHKNAEEMAAKLLGDN